MIRTCGGALGLLGFSIAVMQGLWVGNPTDVILVRAIWSLILMCMLGLVVGWMALRILDEHSVAKHQEMFREVEESPEAPPSSSPPLTARPAGPASQGSTGGRTASAG